MLLFQMFHSFRRFKTDVGLNNFLTLIERSLLLTFIRRHKKFQIQKNWWQTDNKEIETV